MQYGDPLGSGAPAHRVLPEDVDRDGKRTCTDCGQTKPLDDFALDSRSRLGRKRICRRCTTNRSLTWQRANWTRVQEMRRVRFVARMYGEAGAAAERRRIAGEGCDVCGRRTKRMAIDHCHDTKRVRGLLCKDCNLILGWVEDDPARLRALADYVEPARRA